MRSAYRIPETRENPLLDFALSRWLLIQRRWFLGGLRRRLCILLDGFDAGDDERNDSGVLLPASLFDDEPT